MDSCARTRRAALTEETHAETGRSIMNVPVAFVARGILASDSSVQSVMMLDYDGKVVAYERAAEATEYGPPEGHPLLLTVPDSRLLVYLRFTDSAKRGVLVSLISRILGSPSVPYTQ